MVRIRNRLERPGTYGLRSNLFLPGPCTQVPSRPPLGPASPMTSEQSCTLPDKRWPEAGYPYVALTRFTP